MFKTDDTMWVVVLAKAAATVKLYAGNRQKKYDVGPGLSKLSFPLVVGAGMGARMKRAGAVVAECEPKEFIFAKHPETYNFNACVARSGVV
jgi:hypothetical protein